MVPLGPEAAASIELDLSQSHCSCCSRVGSLSILACCVRAKGTAQLKHLASTRQYIKEPISKVGLFLLFAALNLVNPHQRCGYSVSPFARKDTFLYSRVWKWVGGDGGTVVVLGNGSKTH